MVVAATLMLSACGRNWCIAGLGPCEMFKKLEGTKPSTNVNFENPCGWNATGAPRNGLSLRANAALPIRVGQPVELLVQGGLAPYRAVLKNPASGTIVVNDVNPADPRSWRFTPSVTGMACVKVLENNMNIDDACDTCWLAIPVIAGTAVGGTRAATTGSPYQGGYVIPMGTYGLPSTAPATPSRPSGPATPAPKTGQPAGPTVAPPPTPVGGNMTPEEAYYFEELYGPEVTDAPAAIEGTVPADGPK